MGLREDKKRETRASIVATALELFRERGFDDVRVQDVVRRLRISEGTFFNYFPTKHAVLEEVGERLVEQGIEALQADAARADLPVPERLEATCRAFARGFELDPALAALLATHTSFFSPGRAERLARVHLMLADLFADGQAAGDIRDDIPAVHLADGFLGMCTAIVHTWIGEQADSLEARLLGAARVFVDGAGTRRPAPVGGRSA